MKAQSSLLKRGFTLLETVIAIGVLAVLLTGFMLVFAPAAAGIKKTLNVQEADRLSFTLEQELMTLRGNRERVKFTTEFGKAFEWIKDGADKVDDAILVYQYRGSLSNVRPDGTPKPMPDITGKMPGKDYVVQAMARRRSDREFIEDLAALQGNVFLVKCRQLILSLKGDSLITGRPGQITDPKNSGGAVQSVDLYPEAVIAFSADFYALPAKSKAYFDTRFAKQFPTLETPVFTRNLAVRR